MRVGVIDVGTNSVRVLVADVVGESGAPVVRDVRRDLNITRLGEGVDSARALGAQPLARTVEAIARYAEVCRNEGAERVRIIATSAVRDARNRDEFLTEVERATGLRADVLSGEEEANLGFAGATAAIEEPAPYLVCDVGGGSTELVFGTARAERFVSMDIGSVRLTERHVAHDPPAGKEIDALAAVAAAQVERAFEVVGAGARTLVGLAGTMTTVAAIHLGLKGYDRDAIHHAHVPSAAVVAIRERLSAMTSAERRSLPAMPPGREDVIVGGIVIVEQVLARFGFGEYVVSESDILDGTALALAEA